MAKLSAQPVWSIKNSLAEGNSALNDEGRESGAEIWQTKVKRIKL